MMDEQPPKDSTPPGSTEDDLDTQAILARRRAFVASALAGMSLSAASCEAQVSATASVSASAGSAGGGAIATPVAGPSAGVSEGAVVAQPCLMIAATPEDSGMMTLSELDAGAGAVIAAPCLMVASPELRDSGARADVNTDGRAPLAMPTDGRPAPCLSMARDAAGSLPTACLRMAVPRDAGGSTPDAAVIDATTGRALRDGGVRAPTPTPCLEMAVPRACLLVATFEKVGERGSNPRIQVDEDHEEG
jgi:hypothetical protein